MLKKPIALLRSISLVGFLLLSSVFALAQVSVSGKVTDESNKPLDGVTVQVEGTTTGTRTNADGTYQIRVPSATSVLQFSFVGFADQKIGIKNRSQINVLLASANTSM